MKFKTELLEPLPTVNVDPLLTPIETVLPVKVNAADELPIVVLAFPEVFIEVDPSIVFVDVDPPIMLVDPANVPMLLVDTCVVPMLFVKPFKLASPEIDALPLTVIPELLITKEFVPD